MDSYKNLERILHIKYLSALNLFRFVQSDAFRFAYSFATDDEKAYATKLIAEGCYDQVTMWARKLLQRHRQFDLLDVRYLREVASDRGIPRYSNMNRMELLSALNERSKNVG